jgi:hypothetical protein
MVHFVWFLGVEVFVLSGFLIGRILFELYKDDFTDWFDYLFPKKGGGDIANYFLVLVLNLVITFVLFDWTRIEVCYIFFLPKFSTTMLPFFPDKSLSVLQYVFTDAIFFTFHISWSFKSSQAIYLVVLCYFFFWKQSLLQF